MDRDTPPGWKITVLAPRMAVEAALLAHEEVADWDPEIVLSGSECAADRPEEWRLEAYLPRAPRSADRHAVAALFSGQKVALVEEPLPDLDWVTLSQHSLAPIREGRFHVHTPDHPAIHESGVIDFSIPASQAFGTGQHATTAGCLAMLGAMKAAGLVLRNIADIGTGTGLLGFAARALWPRALVTVSDIDRAAIAVVLRNAEDNGIALGGGAGQIAPVHAPGLDHPLLAARAPYDAIIANILAGPLIDLAPRFARALVPGGQLLLAGLLDSQEAAVRAACRRAGFRLAAREQRGDWVILWLRLRPGRARAVR
ncbi:MAG: 50S ribosomal protein L11 methyltransferase [Sphingomonadales bacterium]|nr:50S ribosomal protein L11 methyltransferase [Sphingomonadales bacterium]